MNEEEFINKLKKEANFTHSGYQKEILWGRLQAYIDTPSSRGLWHFGFRFAYVAIFAFGVLLTSAGVTFASQSSLPGEPLYPVMRWSEEAVIFVKFDETARRKARMELTTKRVNEVSHLMTQNPEKAEEVLDEYESQIEDYAAVFMDDPNLSENLRVTLLLNRELLMMVVDEAPDSIKIKIQAIIEKEYTVDQDEDTNEEQEIEEGSTKGETTEENKTKPLVEEETSGTSVPQP